MNINKIQISQYRNDKLYKDAPILKQKKEKQTNINIEFSDYLNGISDYLANIIVNSIKK